MAASETLIAAIDPPTATIIVALIMAAGAVATRWAPKTRSESAVDHAGAKLSEAQRWQLLVDETRKDRDMWRAEVESLRRELAEERDERAKERVARDRKIGELERQIDRLRERIDRV